MPILNNNAFEFLSRSPDQTRRIGARLGNLLEKDKLVCLNGDLGSGKTTLVQGIAQGWGSPDPVTSPTFVLINNYNRIDGQYLSHLDAYRLKDSKEAEDLDIDFFLENGPLIVEWPERIAGALPQSALWVDLIYRDEQQRLLLFRTEGEGYEDIILQLRKRNIYRNSMILSIDTSTQWLSISLYDYLRSMFLYEKTWKTHRRHTIELAVAVKDLLEEEHLKAENLSAVAVALGPGSFTSLRIGLAFVKGLSMTHHIPCIGVPTFDIQAYAQPASKYPLICIMSSGRNRLTACHYQYIEDRWICQDKPYNTTSKELSEKIEETTLISGEVSEQDRKLLARKWKKAILCSPANGLRRASFLAEIASKRLLNDEIDDINSLSPIYVRTTSNIPDD